MKEGEGCGQHGEDRILNLFFRDQEVGLLVDVGASDGFWNSNSRMLLERGWAGILIEPEPSQFQQLKKLYQDRDKVDVACLNLAIGLKEEKRTFYCGGQVSTFSEDVKLSAEVNHQVKYTEIEMQIRPLTKVLSELAVMTALDFLTIDAEGMNYEVWQSLDADLFRPRLVCMEGRGYHMKGYKELCRCGCNTFYVREDLCDVL